MKIMFPYLDYQCSDIQALRFDKISLQAASEKTEKVFSGRIHAREPSLYELHTTFSELSNGNAMNM